MSRLIPKAAVREGSMTTPRHACKMDGRLQTNLQTTISAFAIACTQARLVLRMLVTWRHTINMLWYQYVDDIDAACCSLGRQDGPPNGNGSVERLMGPAWHVWHDSRKWLIWWYWCSCVQHHDLDDIDAAVCNIMILMILLQLCARIWASKWWRGWWRLNGAQTTCVELVMQNLTSIMSMVETVAYGDVTCLRTIERLIKAW